MLGGLPRLYGFSGGFRFNADAFPLDASETTDSDGDSIGDNSEVMLGTNPLLADSDNDGLSDSREIELGTDPVKEDSDADGTSDGADDLPLDPSDSVDTDGDGIGDNRDHEPFNIKVAYYTRGKKPLVEDAEDARNVIADLDDLEVIRLNTRKYELTGVFARDLPHWNFFEEQDRQVMERRKREEKGQ